MHYQGAQEKEGEGIVIEIKEKIAMTDVRSMPKVRSKVANGPVMVAAKGRPEFVLMTVEQYQEMTKEIGYLKKLLKEIA